MSPAIPVQNDLPLFERLPVEIVETILRDHLEEPDLVRLGQTSRRYRRLADAYMPPEGDLRELTMRSPERLARRMLEQPDLARQHSWSPHFTDGQVAAMHAIAGGHERSLSIWRRCGMTQVEKDAPPGNLREWATAFHQPIEALNASVALRPAGRVVFYRSAVDGFRHIELTYSLFPTSLSVKSPLLWDALVTQNRPPFFPGPYATAMWLATMATLPDSDLPWCFSFLQTKCSLPPVLDGFALNMAFRRLCEDEGINARGLQQLWQLGAFAQAPTAQQTFELLFAATRPPRSSDSETLCRREAALQWFAEARILPDSSAMWGAVLQIRAPFGVDDGGFGLLDQAHYDWHLALFRWALQHGLDPARAQREGIDVVLLAAEQHLWSKGLFAELFARGAQLNGVTPTGTTVFSLLGAIHIRLRKEHKKTTPTPAVSPLWASLMSQWDPVRFAIQHSGLRHGADVLALADELAWQSRMSDPNHWFHQNPSIARWMRHRPFVGLLRMITAYQSGCRQWDAIRANSIS